MKRTFRQPAIHQGIVFRSYQVGVNQYALYSDTEPRIRIAQNTHGLHLRSTYSAWLNDAHAEAVKVTIVGERYRSEQAAIDAAIFKLGNRGFKPVSYEADELPPLRDYQRATLENIDNSKSINLPTNTGKSRISAGTIDLTPTWAAMLPVMLLAYTEGTPEGRRIAEEEFKRMAALADERNKMVKGE